MPRSGFEVEGRTSSTSATTCSVSPGRTGAFHRISSSPGDPRTGGGQRAGLEEELEREGDRLESAGDQTAVDRLLGSLRIEMEHLRIVEPAELEDQLFGDQERRGLKCITGLEVVEVQVAIVAHREFLQPNTRGLIVTQSV